MANTFQTNLKRYDDNRDWITNYSLFLGGLNTTHKAIEQYDPLRPGRARIFFVQMPVFMEKLMPSETKRIRHLLEYGFTKVDGIGNLTLETDKMTGGYTAREFEIATLAKDETNAITVGLYEFAGSPVSEYFNMYITGICDPITGFGTYHNAKDAEGRLIPYKQHNHTMEAIYCVTDPTGRHDQLEYACLLTNMMPKGVKKDHFNYSSGESPIVQLDVEFSCNKYESPQINAIASGLVGKHKILRDSLNFNSSYTMQPVTGATSSSFAPDTSLASRPVLTDVPNWDLKSDNYEG